MFVGYGLIVRVIRALHFMDENGIINSMKFVQLVTILIRIIIGSDRPPETKQGIEGKIDRFRSGRVRVRVRDRVRVRFRSPV